MKRYNRLSAWLLSGLLLIGGAMTVTSCDDDDVDTNQYGKSGVNLLGFGPCPLTRLGTMRITGTRLNMVDKVLFPQGNTKVNPAEAYEEAQFNLVSNEEITVTVPDQTIPGKLRLVVGADTIVSVANITFEEEVQVGSISPTTNLRAGDVLTITGEYVWNIASVTFTDHVTVEAEEFLTNTRKEIQIRVPLEARPGELTYSTGEDGEEVAWATPLQIRTAVAEGISNAAPEFGETITLTGSDLDLVEEITFPLVAEPAQFTVSADGRTLTTTVPLNTVSGTVTLTQYSGLVTESPAFTLPLATYAAGSIAPTEELNAGDIVTIAGENLDRIATLILPGDLTLNAGEFTQSATQIQFTVPEGMGDGAVTLVQHENYSITTDKITMHHEGAETPIWQGTFDGSGWNGFQELSWGRYDNDFASFKQGQQIIAYFTSTTPDLGWGCICFKTAAAWANLSTGQIDFSGSADEQRIAITPTAEDITRLQTENGLILQGDGFILHKICITAAETVIWSGTWENSGWQGNQDLAWGGYDWSTFEAGQKIVFTLGFIDPTSGWACLSPRMGMNWADLSCGQIDLTPSADDQTVEFTPTADDINHLINDGGLVITGDGFILKKVSIQ